MKIDNRIIKDKIDNKIIQIKEIKGVIDIIHQKSKILVKITDIIKEYMNKGDKDLTVQKD